MIHKLSSKRTLSYIDTGPSSGETLLYFHGCPGSCLERGEIPPGIIQNNFRFIAVNRPGVGNSSLYSNWDEKTFCEDIITLLDYLNINKVTALGFSWGGRYAAHFARFAQHRTQRLILLSSLAPLEDNLFHCLTEALQHFYHTATHMPLELEKQLSHVKTGKDFMELIASTASEQDKPLLSSPHFRQIYEQGMDQALSQ